MNREITVKIEGQTLVFGKGVSFPVDQVFVNHPNDPVAKVKSFNGERFPWITLWIHSFKDGMLDCEVSNFSPANTTFSLLPLDFLKIRKISLFHDNPKVSELATLKLNPNAPAPPPHPMPHPNPPGPPKQKSLPDFLENISFSAPLERFCFLNGWAEINWSVPLSTPPWQAKIPICIQNHFFSPKLNCIRPYLTRALGGKPIKVQAVVRVCNGAVTIEKAESRDLNRISLELLGEVRFHFLKGELKKWSNKKKCITTADRFFSKISDAGFGDSDVDFMTDIVRAKKTKHSEHIEYLSTLHVADQIRLRLIRAPFSFLFFIPGESKCCFVWETLDGTDATYIWELRPLAYYLNGKRSELKKSLDEVERAIDLIHASGRNDFLNAPHDRFMRVFHDYKNKNGFEKWKEEMEQLLKKERAE